MVLGGEVPRKRTGAKPTYAFNEAVDQLLEDERFSARDVIERLKQAMGFESNQELSRMMGVLPQTISNWRARNSVPYREAIYIAMKRRVSLDYLLTGRGSLRRK